MEKQDCTLCPVCSLYLREGITLKTHLQTHSKDKVIEALLNIKQDPLHTTDIETDTSLSESNTSNQDAITTAVALNQGASSVLPSTSYLQSNIQLTPTTQSLTYDNPSVQSVNNIQFAGSVNNVINNACNTALSYVTFMTNDGNILLVPTYNVCPPAIVPSNAVTPPVVNSCLVVPPSTTVDEVNSLAKSTKYSSASLQSPSQQCSRLSQANPNSAFDFNIASDDSSDDGKDTDEEVASIMKITNPSKIREDSNVMASECCKYSNSERCTFEMNETDVSLNTTQSDATESRVQNDLNYPTGDSGCEVTDKTAELEVANIYDELVTTGVHPSPIPSMNSVETSNSDKSQEVVYSNGDSMCGEKGRRQDISVADCVENRMLENEKDQYILPNDEIPGPVNCDFSFLDLSKNLPTSPSLSPSGNKAIFADQHVFIQKSTTNSGRKSEMELEADVKSQQPKINAHTKLTNYLVKLADEEDDTDDFRIHIADSVGSSCSSRVSPFNIQTDESMPATGELSGHESLSSTENSVWELQVQPNAGGQSYSIPCGSEQLDMKLGLQSIMTEMTSNPESQVIGTSDLKSEDEEDLIPEAHKSKVVREFHCFYCRETFNAWKLRHDHIESEHSEEDGLTIETLFGKRLNCKPENDVVKEEDGSAEIEENVIICRICSATFKTSLTLLDHLKETHGIRKRSCVCPTCFERFDSADDYQQHILNVHPYECMTCGKKFHTRPGYMLHQKRHMKVKPYSCDVCDKSFVTKQKLTEHVNIHTGNNPIKCELCDSQFKRYSNYQQHKKYLHMNCKRKLKDFVCQCGQVFHSKAKLTWHQETHDVKPKQCPFCVERFVHVSSLTRHIRKWHNQTYLSELVNKKKARNVACPVCNVLYLHTSLQTHMKIHRDAKPFSCTECSKTFRTKWNLKLHRWTHTTRSAKPYKCKLCVKAYIHKTDYDAHIRSHNNSRPYSCNVCGRQFIRKYNCIRHLREHIEPRSHKCDICGKLFSRSYYLTEHQKVHTGEKPHICHFCGKASATKSNHNKHVKMHTGARDSLNSEI